MTRNPILAWGFERLRTERKTVFAVLIFCALFYCGVGLASLIWSYGPPGSRQLQDLGTIYYYLAWSVNALLLLLWAPSRLAQGMAQEKARGTLDMIRLTGLGGWTLAIGFVGNTLLLPATLGLLTLPIILLGLGAEGGLSGTARGYLGLLPLAVIYTLGAGLVGLVIKKAQNAGSSAIFAVLLLLGITAATNFAEVPELKPLSLLGPWGSGMATLDDHEFQIRVLGLLLPGEFVQLPFHAAVICALGLGLSRRLSGHEGGLVGSVGALAVAAAVTLVGGITFFPDLNPQSLWGRPNMPTRLALTLHFVCMFLGMLLLAVELPVRWQSLVRGLARRDADDPPFDHERLTLVGFLPGLLLPTGMAALMLYAFLYAGEAAAGGAPQVSVAGLAVAVLLMASSWLFAALVCQVVQLWLQDRNAPLMVSLLVIGLLWFGPFAASYGLRYLHAPPGLYELPRIASPFYGLYAAAHATSAAATASLDPLALATACALLYACLSGGLVHVLRVFIKRAEEQAEGLVALPADAYGAPGTLTQRCESGHLYSETWTQCPHCVGARRST